MKPVKKIKPVFNSFLKCFFFLIIFACTSKQNISEDKLSKIYCDVLIAEETFSNQDSLQQVKEKVFRKYNVTKEEYINSLESYSADADKWESFFNRAEAYLDSLKKANSDPSTSS